MARTVKNWAKHYADIRTQQQRRPAQNASRPAPGLNPPSQENAWVAERIAAQQAAEEADRQARQEPPE